MARPAYPAGVRTRQIPARTTVTDVTERRKGGGKYPRSYNRRRLGVAVVRAGSAVVHRTNAVDGKGAASEDILTRMHALLSTCALIRPGKQFQTHRGSLTK